MKKVLFTQRVEIVESYGERRDCIDQCIPRLIRTCGYLPIAVTNSPEMTLDLLENIDIGGIVLTGGNSLVKYGGNAPERDETEKLLLEHAIKNHIPVYGLCRGMQFVLDFFGYPLERVDGHVAVKHEVSGGIANRVVNSFHNYGCLRDSIGAAEELEIMDISTDGVIEAVKHRDLPILCTMWHPERNNPFEDEDIKMIKELFGE